MLYLFDQLKVDWNAGGLWEPEYHVCSKLIHYTHRYGTSRDFWAVAPMLAG
jgi:hypothetical protein